MALIDQKTKEWVIGYFKSGNLGTIDVDEFVAGIIDIVTATITTATITNLDVTTNLNINGSLDFKTVTKTADYTAADEVVIFCNAISNNITITLPAIADSTDRVYYIVKTDSSEHTVTIECDGTEKIQREEKQIINAQDTSLTIIPYSSTEWRII